MEPLKSVEAQVGQVLDAPLLQVQGVKLTLFLVLQALLILVVTAIFARLFTRFLRRKVFARARLSVGAQASIARVLNYLIMLVGFFVALQHVGVNLTALAALGAVFMVGIGLGLQNITNNFVSGLILLFERPIQVGDFVEVKGALGTVRAINARSTTIDTQDNVTIIVPNSHFVSESVTNWSYKDARTRIHVRVHAAYGEDVDKVQEILLEVARAHPQVLEEPMPRVQFYEFGESALHFDLLVWIFDPTEQFFIRSDLNFAICHAFRQKGIRIPFPQRDLHLRSGWSPPRESEPV